MAAPCEPSAGGGVQDEGLIAGAAGVLVADEGAERKGLAEDFGRVEGWHSWGALLYTFVKTGTVPSRSLGRSLGTVPVFGCVLLG